MADEQAMEQQGDQPSDPGKYNVNFFRPKSEHARSDKKIISIMLIIWAVAVFGFQFLLILTNKPTPEPAYETFQKVWANVEDGTADDAAQQQFSRSVLSVLGKNIAVKEADKAILREALCYSVNSLLPKRNSEILDTYVADCAKLADAGDADQQLSTEVAAQTKIVAASIGLADTGFDKLMIGLLSTSLISEDPTVLSEESKIALPGIMELFLVHNRGPLTDTKFLGFPFHYWYTAQFLLILFVVLCLIYAVLIDKINAKHGLQEK